MIPNIILSYLLIASAGAVRNWDYTFTTLDIETKADYVSQDLKLVRIKRGDYAIEGSIVLGRDLGPNDKFSAHTFRSPRGNDDYKPTPFNMPKQDFDEFINSVYKEVMMEDLTKCSNFIHFEDKWDGVIKADTYTLNMCKFNVGNWPDNMIPGYYKFVANFYDENDNVFAICTLVVEIETTLGIGK